jgi:acyl dehydratase
MGRRYAKVSGDFNPIHWHALTARPFGFKRAIVHGMWTLAACLARLGEALPTAGVTVRCDFLKPVVLPSEVHFRAGPLLEGPDEGGLQMRLDLDKGAALVASIS